MGADTVTRRLAALLSADAVGYSRLMGEDEGATLATLKAHRDAMSGLVVQHGGRVVDAVGDNVLAEFRSVVDAVACGLEIQERLRAANADLPPERRMEFRIGIHLGDIIVEGEVLYGDGVNIAARLESLAEPGGICVSGTVHEQVRNRLPVSWEDLGEQALKNIVGTIRVFRPHSTTRAAGEGPSLTVPGFAGRPAIAVLAFDNLSGDPEQEYFADGIAEDLITRLSSFRSFPVIARNSSFAYKGKPVDVKEISSELGVRYVVEGSVRRAGDRIRVSVQLIDATSGHHVWAERYDRRLEDIFALQDEIVEMVVESIEPALHRAEERRVLRKPPETYDAWDCVHRGSWHMNRFTKEDVHKAQAWMRKACEIDPTFAPAFSGVALAHLTGLIYQTSDSPATDLVAALQAAEKCLLLSQDDHSAHLALGAVHGFMGHYEKAIAAAQRALDLSPSSALAHQGLAFSLAFMGRSEEAVAMAEKALRLTPKDAEMRPVLYYVIAAAHLVADRYEEACAWATRSRELNPGYPPTLRLLAASLGQLGRAEEARAVLGELMERVKDFSIDTLRLYLPPAIVDRYVEGWRKAGWNC